MYCWVGDIGYVLGFWGFMYCKLKVKKKYYWVNFENVMISLSFIVCGYKDINYVLFEDFFEGLSLVGCF